MASKEAIGQLLYASKYDTGVLSNHSEEKPVQGSDQRWRAAHVAIAVEERERAYRRLKAKAWVISRGSIR
jgi:hypothetical protein